MRRDKLIVGDKIYYYSATAKLGRSEYYRCQDRSCTGRLIKKGSQIEITNAKHTCTIGAFECDLEKARQLIRQRAMEDTLILPSRIVEDVKALFSPAVQQALPKDETLWGYIRNYRREAIYAKTKLDGQGLMILEDEIKTEENLTNLCESHQEESFDELHQPENIINVNDSFISPTFVNENEYESIDPLCVEIELDNGNGNQVVDSNSPQLRTCSISRRSSKSRSIPASGNNFNFPCLICFDQITATHSAFNETVENNKIVMFLMKKMLEVGSEELINFMEESEYKRPSEWVQMCKSCSNLAKDAFAVNNQILRLEKKLEVFKFTILDKIKKSSGTRNNNKKVKVDPHSITHRVRKQVCERAGVIYPQVEVISPNFNTVEFEAETNSDPDWNEAASVNSENEDSDEEYSIRNNKRRKIIKSKSPLPVPRRKIETPNTTNAKTTRASSLANSSVNNRSKHGTFDTPRYTCATCPSLIAMNFDAFLQHLIFHWKKPNKCTECQMYLSENKLLIDKHWSDFHSNRNCASKFTSVQFNAGRLWGCEKCDEKFTTFKERDCHEKRTHQFEFPLQVFCSICPESFRSTNEIRLHKALDHPKEASMNCCYCDESFKATSKEGVEYLDRDGMRKHAREKHIQARHDVAMTSASIATRRRNLLPSNYHCVARKSIDLQACSFCGAVFREGSCFTKLRRHLKKDHGISDIKKAYPCPVCHKETYPTHLWNHLKVSHGPQTVCDTCGDVVKPRNLAVHAFESHGVMLEGCTLQECNVKDCGYKTVSRDLWVKHMKIHDGSIPTCFPCQLCGKTFTTSGSRLKHERIHVNSVTKPFQCNLCGKCFADPTYLHEHKKFVHRINVTPSQFAVYREKWRMKKRKQLEKRKLASKM